MKIINLFGLLLFSLYGFSQWTPIGLTTTSSLYSINVSGNSIYIGGVDTLFISNDNGLTWGHQKVADQTGGSLYMQMFTGLSILDASTFVGTGMMLMGNSEVILKTTNGANYWTMVSLNNTGTWPRQMNDLTFPSSLIGFSVGSNGRILKTTNGGTSWTAQSSGASTEIFNVQSFNTTKLYASGGGNFFKTTNGGTNWTKYSVGSGAKYLSMFSNSTGFVASDSKVYKTINDGFSWTALNATFSNISAFCALNKDTILLSDNSDFYITRNGGQYWETFPAFSGEKINKIYFTDINNGFIVCNDGTNYKTSNLGGNTSPVCSFTTTTTSYCADVLINFTNQSPASYTFQWIIDGVVVSSAYNYSYTPTQGSQSDTIKLVAYNGFTYDTCIKVLNIQPGLGVNDFVIASSQDTLCPNTRTVITVLSSQLATNYKLTKGTLQIGSTRSGTGDTLCFYTGNLSLNTNFTVTAWKTNSCGTQQKTQTILITVVTVNYSLQISAAPSSVCSGDSTFIRIINSQSGVYYQLKDNSSGALIGSAVAGNNDTIFLPTPSITYNRTFKIMANFYLGCGGQMNPTATVTVRTFIVKFESPEEGNFIGDSIHFTNASTADSYRWIFDNSASILNAITLNSAVKYNSIGEKTVTLIGNTVEGCADTLQKNFYVFNHVSDTGGVNCDLSHLNPTPEQCYITAMHTDLNENVYVGKLAFTTGSGCYVNAFHDDNFRFEKYDKYGNLKWERRMSYSGYQCHYSYITGITSDDDGNVYIAGNYWSTDFTISGIGRVNSDYGNSNCQAFVFKFDTAGTAKWVMYTDYSGGVTRRGASDIKFYNNKLYISANLSNGSFIMGNQASFSIPYSNTNLYLLTVNKNGIIEKCLTTTNTVATNLLKVLCTSCNSGWYDQATFTPYPKLKIKNNNELIFYNQGYVGKTDSTFLFNSSFSTFINANYIIPYFPSVAFDDNFDLYFSTSWNLTNTYLTAPYGYLNGTPVNNIKGNLLLKYNLSGNLLWYNLNPFFTSASLLYSNQSNILQYGFFSKFLMLNDQTGHQFGLNGDASVITSGMEGRSFIASISQAGITNWLKETGFITTAMGGTSAYGQYFGNSMAAVTDKCGKAYLTGRTDSVIHINNETITPSSTSHFLIRFSENNSCQFCSIILDSKYNILPAYSNSKIYPNPANSNINIEFNAVGKNPISIDIYNCFGLKVYSNTLSDKLVNENINIKYLKSGIYYLSVKSFSFNETHKFIKE